MQDLLPFMREIIALIRDNETEAAYERVAQAFNNKSNISYQERKFAINQINIELQKAKRQRDLLRQAIQALPEMERLFAEQQIESVVDNLYTAEIASLKAKKRELSIAEK